MVQGWKPQRLALVSLLMPWLDVTYRVDQFEQTREFLAGHKRWRHFPETYTGFAKAMRRDGAWLIDVMRERLRQQLPEIAGRNWTRNGRVILAVDGSRIESPRTPGNERKLGCAGKERSAPQVMVTALYHVDSGLPFDARIDCGVTGETTLLHDMLDDLPEQTLLTADSGFFSAKLAKGLLERSHDFLMRVGGNKHLLTELFDHCEFGEQQVWVWTEEMKFASRPPLSLRLIEIETDSPNEPNVFLLTNLSPEEMTDNEASDIYKMRWGVEVMFRSAKQTLESQTLRSRTPELAIMEAAMLIISLTLFGGLVTKRQPNDNRRREWSPAKTRRVVNKRMRHGSRSGGRWNRGIGKDFRGCIGDEYERRGPKSTRRHPQKKKEKPPMPPKVRPANESERQKASRLIA